MNKIPPPPKWKIRWFGCWRSRPDDEVYLNCWEFWKRGWIRALCDPSYWIVVTILVVILAYIRGKI